VERQGTMRKSILDMICYANSRFLEYFHRF
jgi:hypothetical protein